jgi:hypothetical protein
MKKKSSSPGDPKAISSDLRAQLESQSAEIEKMKRSAADSKRDKDRHKKETWERNNPDGDTKGGRKKGGGGARTLLLLLRRCQGSRGDARAGKRARTGGAKIAFRPVNGSKPPWRLAFTFYLQGVKKALRASTKKRQLDFRSTRD